MAIGDYRPNVEVRYGGFGNKIITTYKYDEKGRVVEKTVVEEFTQHNFGYTPYIPNQYGPFRVTC